MPTFEYACEFCRSIFEELFLTKQEVQKYSQKHPCPSCKRSCKRIPSATNFQFKGVAEGDPTRRGNSGSHDLDYPSLDKAIGRSANRKWKEYDNRKKTNDAARKQFGTNTLSVGPNGQLAPTDSNTLSLREKGLKIFSDLKKKNSSG